MPALASQPYVVINMRDASDSVTHISVGAKHRDISLSAVASLADILPSDCVPVSVYVASDVVIEPVPGIPSVADGSRCAVLIFDTVVSGDYAIVVIPGIKSDCISVDNPSLIDISNGAIMSLVSELTNGNYVNKFGSTITNLLYAGVEYRERTYVSRFPA